jgi:hypothetical protein
LKRWYTLFQLPLSVGRSRHGAPVRTTHSTDSTNSRLSAAVAPGSLAFPGTRFSIRDHRASLKYNRNKAPSHTRGILESQIQPRGNPLNVNTA